MKINHQQKLYKITYGETPIQTRNNGKPILNEDISCLDSIKVIAIDVYDALSKTEKYLLKLEEEELKEDMQVFVEEVELITYIDDLPDDNE